MPELDIDPDNFDSPPPSGTEPANLDADVRKAEVVDLNWGFIQAIEGIITLDELWSEIGMPVTDNHDAQSWFSEAMLQGVINRVLRQIEAPVEEAILSSRKEDRFSHLTTAEELEVSISDDNPMVADAVIPDQYLPWVWGKVVDSLGNAMSRDQGIHVTAQTQVFQKYRFETSGRRIQVLPRDTKYIVAEFIPMREAIISLLSESTEKINQAIIQAAKAALEARIEQYKGVESQGKRQMPST